MNMSNYLFQIILKQKYEKKLGKYVYYSLDLKLARKREQNSLEPKLNIEL